MCGHLYENAEVLSISDHYKENWTENNRWWIVDLWLRFRNQGSVLAVVDPKDRRKNERVKANVKTLLTVFFDTRSSWVCSIMSDIKQEILCDVLRRFARCFSSEKDIIACVTHLLIQRKKRSSFEPRPTFSRSVKHYIPQI